jgi:2-desacetyl-2-hydroxyethyl bacteriochlorophyllide A dehydrogenase
MMKAKTLFFEGEKTISIREEPLASPGEGQLLVQARYSAISAGTEMLFYRGNFPQGMATDVSLKSLSGRMGYPMQYGYALVGKVIEIGHKTDTNLLHKSVFLFHPHQSHIVISSEEVFPIPLDLDGQNALFLPNMETAVGCVMDGRPLLGEKVVVFGQGVVGLLLTAILSNFPLGNLAVIDPLKMRREIAEKLGAAHILDPLSKTFSEELKKLLHSAQSESDPSNGTDLIFEVSGNPEVLNTAISFAGSQSRIVIGSWYGNKQVQLNLGAEFHRNRLQIISSQVSTLDPGLRGRWTKERRLNLVWKWINKIKPSHLISHKIPFVDAKKAFELLDERPQEALQVILTYEGSE